MVLDDDDNNNGKSKQGSNSLGSIHIGSGNNLVAVYDWLRTNYEKVRLPPKYRLISEKTAMERSVQSVRFAVMCSSVNSKLLTPNYPIMVTPGAEPGSFPNTNPFGFNSATYFLPMCSALGIAIASMFMGGLSDRVGRKRVILLLAWISTAGSVVKFFCRATFWGFCAAQFVFGFFLSNLPTAMAYVSDVFTKKVDKERELGILVSYYVVGSSGGGIVAILMGSGLFTPLLVGAAILLLSALNTQWNMVEAGDLNLSTDVDGIGDEENNNKGKLQGRRKEEEDGDEEDIVRPKTIEQRALWNIVMGSVADNFGSTGLFPLCLSPLAFEHYLLDFTEANPPLPPVMSIAGYQWLSVCVAFMVVPATMLTPYMFRKLGVAGTCVMGNLCTAVVTLFLLLIGNAPATGAWFGTFVAVLYLGFPLTVMSQLTTGPMLDVIAPKDKIGFVQGLNNAAMNFGMAIAPWLFGLLADAAGTNIAIWVGIGISCLAAAINCPLARDSRFGRKKPLPPSAKRILKGEDPEFVEKALAGEWVDQQELTLLNLKRLGSGNSFLVPRVRPYQEEKEDKLLDELHKHAGESFEQRRNAGDLVLKALSDPNNEKSAEEFCEMLNASVYKDERTMNIATSELGTWVGEYLADTGYNPHTQSTIIKQMVMTAFPPINFDGSYTPENLETSLLRARQVLEDLMKEHESQESKTTWTFSNAFGNGTHATFYS